MSNINLYQQYNRLIPIIADLQQLAEPEDSLRNAVSIITRLSGYDDAQDLGRVWHSREELHLGLC